MENKTAPSDQVYYQPPQNPPPYQEYPNMPPPHPQQPHQQAHQQPYQQPHQQPQPVFIQPQPAVTVIPSAGVIITHHSMGTTPSRTNCRACGSQIVTRVEFKPSIRTHMMALLLCLVGCWPCACIPYCMDTCNNVEHYCPNCGAYIGAYIN